MTGKLLEAASHLSLTSGLSTTEKQEPETLEFIKNQILSTTGVSVFISDSDSLNLTHTHTHTRTHSGLYVCGSCSACVFPLVEFSIDEA